MTWPNTTNTNWSLLRRSVCRHRFQNSFISTTWHLVSYHSHRTVPDRFWSVGAWAIDAAERKDIELGGRQWFSHFKSHYVFICRFRWTRIESTQACDLLHSKVKLIRKQSAIKTHSLSLSLSFSSPHHPHSFRFNAIQFPPASGSKKGCVRRPSAPMLQMLQRTFWFVEQTQSNWIIINNNNKTNISMKHEKWITKRSIKWLFLYRFDDGWWLLLFRVRLNTLMACWWFCVLTTDAAALLLRSRFICMSAIPSRLLHAFAAFFRLASADNNKILEWCCLFWVPCNRINCR